MRSSTMIFLVALMAWANQANAIVPDQTDAECPRSIGLQSDHDTILKASIIARTKFQRWAKSNGFQVGTIVPPNTAMQRCDLGYIAEVNGFYRRGPDDERAFKFAALQQGSRPDRFPSARLRQVPKSFRHVVIGQGDSSRVVEGNETPMHIHDPDDTLYVIKTAKGERIPIRESEILEPDFSTTDEPRSESKKTQQPSTPLDFDLDN